ncbi:MAG: heavy metal-binding domain-containing protein [Bacteroidia bacterium]
MKKFVFLLSLSACFFACQQAETNAHKTTDAPKQDSVKTEVAAAVYQCPMDCEKGKTYDKAGDCPVCKMALEKK